MVRGEMDICRRGLETIICFKRICYDTRINQRLWELPSELFI